MSYVLYLRELPDSDPQTSEETGVAPRYDWVLLDATGTPVAEFQNQSQETIQQTLASNSIDSPRIVAVIPAFDVICCSANIPAKQTRYIHQALPFAVEEQVAQDIEDMHLALGRRIGEAWSVAAIDRERMETYMATLAHWDYPIEAMVADAMLLPTDAVRWSALIDGEQALITGSDGEWFDVPAAGLGVFLDSLVRDGAHETPPPVKLYLSAQEREARAMELAALEQNPDMAFQYEVLDLAPLNLMAQYHHRDSGKPINLCQGEFAIRESGTPWYRWRAVAAVAVVGIVLQLGFIIADGIYHNQRATVMEQEALALYRDIFPDDRRVSVGTLERDLRRNIAAAEAGGSRSEFLSLLRHAGYQYVQLDDRNQVRFDSINFSRQRGELVMELRGDSFSRLDRIRSGLNEAGLQARIGSVVNEPDHTRGRITVSGGDS